MKWYLLKDRRQLGPFTKEEIIEGLNSDQFDLKDYLLPESAVKDQSSFAYVLLSTVVGPEIVFDIEKRKQKNSNNPTVSSSSQVDFKSLNKSEHENRLKLLKDQFEKDLESSQLAQSKHSQERVPATTGNIDAYSASSSYSQRVRVEGSFSKLWLGLALGSCVIAAFFAYQKGFFESQKSPSPLSSQNLNSPQDFTQPTRSPADIPQANRRIMNHPSEMQRLRMGADQSRFKNRMPSNVIQLPIPTTRSVEEAPTLVHTEEAGADSQEPIAQRNPAKMRKILQQKNNARKNGEALVEGESENSDDPEAAQEAEPGSEDENNIE